MPSRMARTISPSVQFFSGPTGVRFGATSTPRPGPFLARKFVSPPSSGRLSLELWQPVQPLTRRVATSNWSGVASDVTAATDSPCSTYRRYTPTRPATDTAVTTRNSSALAPLATRRVIGPRVRQARVVSQAVPAARAMATASSMTPVKPVPTACSRDVERGAGTRCETRRRCGQRVTSTSSVDGQVAECRHTIDSGHGCRATQLPITRWVGADRKRDIRAARGDRIAERVLDRHLNGRSDDLVVNRIARLDDECQLHGSTHRDSERVAGRRGQPGR